MLAALLISFQWVDVVKDMWCREFTARGGVGLGGLELGLDGRGTCKVSWAGAAWQCSGFGVAGEGDTAGVVCLLSFFGVGGVVCTRGWECGRGAGARACPFATCILGHGLGEIWGLSFVRGCHAGPAICTDSGADQSSIGQGSLDGNAVGRQRAWTVGARRIVWRSEPRVYRAAYLGRPKLRRHVS